MGTELGTYFFKSSLKGFSPDMPFAEGLAKQWENRSSFMMENTDKIACWEILQNSNYGEDIVKESLAEFKVIMMQFLQGAIERKEIVPVSKEETLAILAFMEAADESKKRKGKPVEIAKIMKKAGI